MTPRDPSLDRTPRGRLERVPPSVRHLWSLLYRATRRQSVRVDQLQAFVTKVIGAHRQEVDVLHARVDQLQELVADQASLLGDALRQVDRLEAEAAGTQRVVRTLTIELWGEA